MMGDGKGYVSGGSKQLSLWYQNTCFCSRTLPANTMPGPFWKVLTPVSLKLHEDDQERAAMNHSPALTWDS